MSKVRIELEVPKSALIAAHIKEKEAAKELQKIIALYLFENGVLSIGKACELAGISRWEFFELNQKAQIPLHYDADDYYKDINTLRKIIK